MAPQVGACAQVNKTCQRYKPKGKFDLQSCPALVLNVNVHVDVPELFDLALCSRGSSPTKGVCTAASPSVSQIKFAQNLKQQGNPYKEQSVDSQYCVNKGAFSTDSVKEIFALPDFGQISNARKLSDDVFTAVSPSASQAQFMQTRKKQDQENPYNLRLSSTGSQYCLNKDDYSSDSLKEIFALPDNFLEDMNGVNTANTRRSSNYGIVSRRYSRDSLHELNQMPSIANDINTHGLQCTSPQQPAHTPAEGPPSVESMLFPRMYTLEPMPAGMTPPDFSSANLGKLVPLVAKPVDSSSRDQGHAEQQLPYFVVFYDPTMRDPTGPKMNNSKPSQN